MSKKAQRSLSPWERWHRASDDGEGKPVSREPPCSDKLSLWESDAIAAPALLRQHPCPLRRSAPALPKGEPKGILPDGFSPFTQETGRFAQVLLIFSPQMWYIQSNLIFYGLTISFHRSKEVFVCCLIVSLRCVFWAAPSIRGGGGGGGYRFTPSGLSAGSSACPDRRNAHHPCRPGFCRYMAHRGW